MPTFLGGKWGERHTLIHLEGVGVEEDTLHVVHMVWRVRPIFFGCAGQR